jgi:SAM-dependent methyltransferase
MRARIRDLMGVASEMGKLDKMVLAIGGAQRGPRPGEAGPQHRLFRDIGDFQWFWLNTTGYRRLPFIKKLLPSLPDSELQRGFIGKSGDHALREGFNAYRTWKRLAAKHGRPVHRDTRILDFGCGWGRILRFFMRDVAPGNLFGVDVMPMAVDLCKETNPWGQFSQVPAFPPSTLPDNHFDLIYLYSVFSHLSQKACDAWITEFSRILKPGGLVIATTWPREFIQDCERTRQGGNAAAHVTAKLSFVGTSDWLSRYDRGEFCHSAVGAGGNESLSESFYGETCIPAAYVSKHWSDRVELCEFVTDHPGIYQHIIVVRKPGGPA